MAVEHWSTVPTVCAELVPYGAGLRDEWHALIDRPDSVCRAGTVRGWSRDGSGNTDRPSHVGSGVGHVMA